jgi:hypothetical protein
MKPNQTPPPEEKDAAEQVTSGGRCASACCVSSGDTALYDWSDGKNMLCMMVAVMSVGKRHSVIKRVSMFGTVGKKTERVLTRRLSKFPHNSGVRRVSGGDIQKDRFGKIRRNSLIDKDLFPRACVYPGNRGGVLVGEMPWLISGGGGVGGASRGRSTASLP